MSLPIFEPIIEAIWAEHIAPKAPLSGPSPEAKRLLADMPIDYMSGDLLNGQQNQGQQNQGFGFFGQPQSQGPAFVEHFRRGADGQVADTQYQLVSRDDAYASQGQGDQGGFWGGGGGTGSNGQWVGRTYYPNQGWRGPPDPPSPSRGIFGLFQPWNWGGHVN
jgi:hypothetical protein